MTTTRPWADGPFALISADQSGDKAGARVTGARRLASEMSVVHNCIIRGINSIYLQCINVGVDGSTEDQLDFANYAYQWAEMLHEHHSVEEETVFPEINVITGVPGLMDGNMEEHTLFHDGLLRYMAFLDKVKQGEIEYDGAKLREIIDGFMPCLHSHLENEIDSLVGLEGYNDKCDWVAWFDAKIKETVTKLMKQKNYMSHVFPVAIILHERDYSDGLWGDFPPIPWLIRWVLRMLYMYKNQQWWRFAPCDFNSQRKELPFA